MNDASFPPVPSAFVTKLVGLVDEEERLIDALLVAAQAKDSQGTLKIAIELHELRSSWEDCTRN